MISRNTTMAVGVVLAAFLYTGSATGLRHTNIKPKVVIVGAGVSGVSTALRLMKHGVEDIQILEARDRMGGRIHTVELSTGDEVDLGAAWIGGTIGNPSATFANTFDIKLNQASTSNYQFRSEHGTFSQEETWKIGEKVQNFVQTEYGNSIVINAVCSIAPEPICSFLSNYATDDTWSSGLEKFLAQQKDTDRDAATSLVNIVAGNEALAPSNVSVVGLNSLVQDKNQPSGDTVMPVGGYHAVYKRFFDEVEPLVQLSTVVKQIKYTSDGCSVETTDDQVYEADICVCSVPLGVLKKKSIEFSPPLSPEKQQAIEDIGYGVLNKAILAFEDAFWAKGKLPPQGVVLPVGVGDGISMFYELQSVMGFPVIVAFSTGLENNAMAWANKTDEEVTASVMSTLRKLYPEAPNPLEAVITRWRSDPFSAGSYSSYAKIGVERFRAGRAMNAQAVEGTLHFAGEHTFYTFNGFVESAWWSGECTAERILGLTEENCPKEMIRV